MLTAIEIKYSAWQDKNKCIELGLGLELYGTTLHSCVIYTLSLGGILSTAPIQWRPTGSFTINIKSSHRRLPTINHKNICF